MVDTSENYPGTLKVSVIVPVRRLFDEDFTGCVESLRAQSYDGGFEAVFIEGGNIAQARNHGIKLSKGEVVAFLDSDCRAERAWLITLLNYQDTLSNVGGIGGPGVSPLEGGVLSNGIGAIYQTYLGSLNSTSLTNTSLVRGVDSLSSHNCIYQREVLERVSGFNETFMLNEDTELSLRIRDLGYCLYFVPDAIVYHKRKRTLRGFAEKFFFWGQSRTRSMLTDRRHIDFRILCFLGLFLLCFLCLFIRPQVSLGMFLIYLIIVMTQSLFSTTLERDFRLMFVMPLLFLIQHTSYALGLLSGFTKGSYSETLTNPEFSVHIEKFNDTK